MHPVLLSDTVQAIQIVLLHNNNNNAPTNSKLPIPFTGSRTLKHWPIVDLALN